jgi:HK97 gp10 family phage protein
MAESIRLTGDRALREAIKKASNPRPVLQAIVRHDTAELAKNVKLETRTAFTKGYSHPPGNTARSTRASFEDGGLTGIVEPQTSYAAYVQYGTRFMDAEPFMTRPFMQVVADFENHIREMAE